MSIARMPSIQPQVEIKINYEFNHWFLAFNPVCAHAMNMKKPLTLLGIRVKTLLGKRTQGWLSHEVGVTDQALSKWMYGKSDPTLSNLRQLARALECSVGYLAGDEEDGDIAAVVDMMMDATDEKRRDIRRISAAHLKSDDDPYEKPPPKDSPERRKSRAKAGV